MARDDFKTESGLLDDYVFTVTDAYFATVPGYRDGTDLFLHWVGKTNSESVPIMTREDYHPSWRCGDGWESIDGGKTAAHPTKTPAAERLGKSPMFNRNSPYGELIDRVEEVTSTESHDPAFDPDPLATLVPIKAETWIGTSWRMQNEERVFNIDGIDRRTTRTLPVEFVPATAEEVPTAAAAPAPATTPAAPPSEKVLQVKLMAAAKKADSHAEFMTAALEIDGVADDEGLLTQVLDESEAGLYAQANA